MSARERAKRWSMPFPRPMPVPRLLESWVGVYFIVCDACAVVKIGESENIRSRLRNLVACHPQRHTLRLLGYLPIGAQRRRLDGGGMDEFYARRDRRLVEQRLHAEFADLRVNGEWFLYTAVAEARIASMDLTRRPYHTAGEKPGT